ncbi:PglZ domain-containing protein [Phocaeicola paurosaccharolyticus]|uniref:PglZ domain-containing protein n=1 Tax=Phocaeicola paurosaccharolyticus TaxID=732242 RepID=UPI0004684C60|nr:PglZ domain-containing protein [Phocaeicola paurosaccharolyticus]
MSTVIDKIYNYFERDPELKVLFIFNDEFLAMELEEAQWKDGYRYVDFKGDWFTTKYKLDTEWANDKVVLYFHQDSPLQKKSLQEKFPLLDVLVANMEYHHQDYAAYMQQYGLPASMTTFVEKNIQQLQSDRMLKMLQTYYVDKSISQDIAIRAFLSSYMGLTRVLDWDNIILRILFQGRISERSKQTSFYVKLKAAPMIKAALDERLEKIFGCSIDMSTEVKVEKLVQVLKYNAIAQNLAPVSADNYKAIRITDSLALQQMNSILELALSQPKIAEALVEVFQELGKDIHDDDFIKWYGTDANYYYIPDQLCIPILRTLMEQSIAEEPKKVFDRLEELMIKHSDNGELGMVMDYDILVARFYECALSLGSLTLNHPDDYLDKYRSEYFLIDQLYRLSIENYYKISPSISLYETVQKVKLALDSHYAKLCNRINLEWMRCVKEAGGMTAVHALRQEDFYESQIKPIQKKVVVIVSDAFRYEVAQELIGVLAKRKHIAHLNLGIAMLPSETKFCKPALLPHRELRLYGEENGTQNMGVDNRILDSTGKRTEQVDSYRSGAICVDYEVVGKYDQEKNREIFKHPLVYVMHNTIDDKSHGATAKEVAESCRDAINELEMLVHKIHETYNVTEVYITSDHGFLFNDQDFKEKDKHKVAEEVLEKSSRYYLTKVADAVPGIVKFPLSEVSEMNAKDIYVAVPEGTNRMAAPSGGYLFTHGGASLQELIIPVIVSRQERGNTKPPVGVMVLDRNLSIQASRLRFKLLQTDAVSMDMTERTINVALYYNDQAVTPVKEFVLDNTDAILDNRKVLVDLTLNQNVNAKVLQLKVYDKDHPLNPLIKENVMNNTLIGNDFDF